MKDTITITGASGFIGGHMVAQFRAFRGTRPRATPMARRLQRGAPHRRSTQALSRSLDAILLSIYKRCKRQMKKTRWA